MLFIVVIVCWSVLMVMGVILIFILCCIFGGIIMVLGECLLFFVDVVLLLVYMGIKFIFIGDFFGLLWW